MKLNFKDLKQQSFSVEAEATDTIATVKSKVAEAKGLDASQMRLIFSGKILADDNTVESYNVEQMMKGYIVCMVQKPKQPAATSSKPPSTPAAPIVAQTPSAPAPATPAPAPAAAVPSTPTPASATTATTAPGSRQFNDPAPLMLGERQAALANMEAMGFPRADCERALRAAFFNPDRAVEYLLTGIPASAEQQPPAPSAQTPAAPALAQATTTTSATPAATADADEPVNLFDIAAAANQGGRTGGAARGAAGGQDALAGMGGEGENLDFLRDNATFQHLRQLVQQQPAMLENVLQQVGASNPQLAQMIASNPQQFLQLLSESDDGEGAPMPPGAQNISVTPEERDAIERLCRLGFERDLVIQAYFACDKNEELAANFLFDHPDDLDDQ